jgi:molybdopterin molybdotransferase
MATHAQYDIGFDEALVRTLRTLARLAPVDVPIGEAEGLVVAEDCTAKVDCPSSSVSRKDGYAVLADDLTDAYASPVKLRIVGTTIAGGDINAMVQSGTAVRITSGAIVPPGADAIVANEFTTDQGQWVLCHRDVGIRRNICERGHDVVKGSRVAVNGEILTPARTGLMAAGGIAMVRVYPRPRIGIIATGDEIVVPGQSLKDGQQSVRPLKARSRLQSQADAGALIQVPEGVEQLDRGTPVYVQVLHHHESGRVPNGEREAEGGSATVPAGRHDG